jgi:hypothetical protein
MAVTDIWVKRLTFEHVVLVVIVVNTALVCAGFIWDSELAEQAEIACLVFFVAELAVQLHRCRWRPHVFARSPWNVFNAIIIVFALLPLANHGASLLRVARPLLQVGRLARVVHLGGHVGHLAQHSRLARLLLLGSAAAGAMIARPWRGCPTCGQPRVQVKNGRLVKHDQRLHDSRPVEREASGVLINLAPRPAKPKKPREAALAIALVGLMLALALVGIGITQWVRGG